MISVAPVMPYLLRSIIAINLFHNYIYNFFGVIQSETFSFAVFPHLAIISYTIDIKKAIRKLYIFLLFFHRKMIYFPKYPMLDIHDTLLPVCRTIFEAYSAMFSNLMTTLSPSTFTEPASG